MSVTDIDGNWVNDAERPFEKLRASLPSLLTSAAARQYNVIIRPLSETPLIQLDDLTRASAGRVRDFAFMVIETSRGNFQVWLAAPDLDEATPKWLKEALDADPNASGAVRVCGSLNFKRKYASDFPIVRLIESAPGRTVTKADLQARGLLAEDRAAKGGPPCAPSFVKSGGFRSRTWPSYEICLRRSPEARTHAGADRSWADYDFALTAADRGFTAEEIADELMIVSGKAREKKRGGRAYAERTARKALDSVRANHASRPPRLNTTRIIENGGEN